MQRELNDLMVTSQSPTCESLSAEREWSSAHSTMLDDFEAMLEAAERITKSWHDSTNEAKALAAAVNAANSNL